MPQLSSSKTLPPAKPQSSPCIHQSFPPPTVSTPAPAPASASKTLQPSKPESRATYPFAASTPSTTPSTHPHIEILPYTDPLIGNPSGPNTPSSRHRHSLRVFIGGESDLQRPGPVRAWTRAGTLWGSGFGMGSSIGYGLNAEREDENDEDDDDDDEEEAEQRQRLPNQQESEEGEYFQGRNLQIVLPELTEEPDELSIYETPLTHPAPPTPTTPLYVPVRPFHRHKCSGDTFVTARTQADPLPTPASPPPPPPHTSSVSTTVSAPTPAQTLAQEVRLSRAMTIATSEPLSALTSPPMSPGLRAHRPGTRARSRSRPPVTHRPVEDERTVVKRDVMLCRREARDMQGKPTTYEEGEERRNRRKSIGWKEFEVVLREGGLELWRVSSLGLPTKRLAYTLPIHPPDAPPHLRLGLASPLDHTLSLTFTPLTRYKHRHLRSTSIILNPRTPTLAASWYTTLHRLLLPLNACRPISPSFEVVIPDLDGVRVRIPVPDAESVRRGEANVMAPEVIKTVVRVVRKTGGWEEVLRAWQERGVELGLCWRRFDRIEWMAKGEVAIAVDGVGSTDFVFGPLEVEKTHILELRPIQHTPDTVRSPDGTILEEPSPVEGYLTRLQPLAHHIPHPHPHPSARHQRHPFGTRLYLSSHAHLLFYSPAARALPPRAAAMPVGEAAGVVHEEDEVLSRHRHGRRREEEGEERDETGRYERAERQMVGAQGVIDLCEIENVRVVGPQEAEARDVVGMAESSITLGSRVSIGRIEEGKWFEVIMANRLTLVFETPTPTAAHEWTTRLCQLSVYWRLRLQADLQAHVIIQRQNQATMLAQEGTKEGTTTVGNALAIATELDDGFDERDNVRAVADPKIWSWCWVAGCGEVLKSGTLCVKPPNHPTFHTLHFVLTSSGHLLSYQPFYRHPGSGQALPTATHHLSFTLPLRGCYVYSGGFCSDDLPIRLDTERVPRIYADGLVTGDSEELSTWAVWRPRMRRYIGSTVGHVMTVKRGRKLGSRGRVWVFRARSRQECEEWVMAVKTGMERWVREEVAQAGGRRRE